ncbi:DgyrCDS10257 [Dimorphilus gyrociliatus]|uniref:DgyrCDS10257 n=1 Tax=Dimorphilus gyrociliatus TaxID=2664684 RepID=A0A7I8VZN7_9ANNE|nr:DgyrCDS10257 [Dimorphilus gyrociliatus]
MSQRNYSKEIINLLEKGEIKKNQSPISREKEKVSRELNMKERNDFQQVQDTMTDLIRKHGDKSTGALLPRSLRKVCNAIPSVKFSERLTNDLKLYVITSLSEIQANEDSENTKVTSESVEVNLQDPRTRPVDFDTRDIYLLVPNFQSEVDFNRPRQMTYLDC